jgi:hypothetical protein
MIPNFLVIILLLFINTAVSSDGFVAKQPDYDMALTTIEGHFDSGIDIYGMKAEGSFQAWRAYAGFPSFRVFGRKVFISTEIDGMDRRIEYQTRRINGPAMTRLGLFTGLRAVKGNNHRGTFFVGTGLSSDFVSLHRDAAYVHFIYDHKIDVSRDFSFGLGILLMYNFDRWQKNPPVNLLPSLRWKLTPRTFVLSKWDNLEVKQFITERIAAVAEIRYDMSFFRLDDGYTVEFETVGAGGGVDIWISGDFYIRARYRENIYKNELLEKDGRILVDDVSSEGRGVKVVLVFGG